MSEHVGYQTANRSNTLILQAKHDDAWVPGGKIEGRGESPVEGDEHAALANCSFLNDAVRPATHVLVHNGVNVVVASCEKPRHSHGNALVELYSHALNNLDGDDFLAGQDRGVRECRMDTG